MVSPAQLGIVTVTYNSDRVLAGFMASLLAQTHTRYQLFVIDNASADRTVASLAAYTDPRVFVTRNTANQGVAAANNQGITAALASGCDSVLLMNNDTEFEPRFLEDLIAEFDALGCDLLVPKILYADPPGRIWYAGGRFSRWRAYASLHDGQGQRDHGQFETPRLVGYAPTCCLLIRKSVFERIGRMDEEYFVYYDDADFCFRAGRAGLRLMYTPGAVLIHKEGSLTGGRQSAFALRQSARNKLYFLKKNLGRTWWLWAAVYEGYLLLRCLARRDSPAEGLIRQRSFWEGVRLNLK